MLDGRLGVRDNENMPFGILIIDLFYNSFKLFRLFFLYRSPTPDKLVSLNNLTKFLRKFLVNSTNDINIILGDFNLPNVNWSQISFAQLNNESEFLSLIFEYGFTQLVKDSTHIMGNILDLIFIDNIYYIQDISVSMPFTNTDHFAVFGNIGPFSIKKGNKKQIYKYDFSKANYDAMNYELSLYYWDIYYNTNMNIENVWISFKNILLDLINRYVPKFTIGKQKHKWSRLTMLAHRKQLKLYRFYRNYPTSNNKSIWLKSYYDARKLKRNDTVNSEYEVLISNNDKRFWSFVKSKFSTISSIPVLKRDNKLIFDDAEKAQIFNDYFGSVFTNDNGINLEFLKSSNTSLEFISFQEDIVLDHLLKLPEKNSYGVDLIPQNVLKKLAFSIVRPLSILFTRIFNEGYIPYDWKIAKIIPIHKKSFKCDITNYRPISLLCSASKIMESIISNKLISFLENNNLLSTSQFGFRRNRSTVTQLLVTLNEWLYYINKGYCVDVIYLDFAKAFDSVSHLKLLQVLASFGIKGKLYDWFNCYLSNRKQFVSIGNVNSSTIDVISGVPQGSVLGPILFLIYINDISEIPINMSVKVFADDSKLYLPYEVTNFDPNLIQNDLNKINDWACSKQLTLSYNKCLALYLGHRNCKHSYYFDSSIIETKSCSKDLGVFVSDNLKFSYHCSSIIKKGFIRLNLIFKSFKSRNVNFLIQLYKSFVRPTLEYSSIVWSPYLLGDIDALERVQRVFTRRIPGMSNYSYLDRLNILNLESLEERRIFFDLVMVYKILHNLVEINSNSFFTLANNSKIRGHSLRLKVNFCRLDIYKYYFTNRIIIIWNSLSEHIVNSSSLPIFKKRLKEINISKFTRGRSLS